MRYAWLLVVIVACGRSTPPADAYRNPNVCTDPPPVPSPLCGGSPGATVNPCGNGVRDACWTRQASDSPCPSYFMIDEACDGSDVPSCASLGFAGGTVACTPQCKVDTTGCSR